MMDSNISTKASENSNINQSLLSQMENFLKDSPENNLPSLTNQLQEADIQINHAIESNNDSVRLTFIGKTLIILSKNIKMINSQLIQGNKRMTERIDQIAQRIDQIGQRIDQMGQRVDQIQQKQNQIAHLPLISRVLKTERKKQSVQTPIKKLFKTEDSEQKKVYRKTPVQPKRYVHKVQPKQERLRNISKDKNQTASQLPNQMPILRIQDFEPGEVSKKKKKNTSIDFKQIAAKEGYPKIYKLKSLSKEKPKYEKRHGKELKYMPFTNKKSLHKKSIQRK